MYDDRLTDDTIINKKSQKKSLIREFYHWHGDMMHKNGQTICNTATKLAKKKLANKVNKHSIAYLFSSKFQHSCERSHLWNT